MNYTQVIEKIEQLKTGKNKVNTLKMLQAFQKISPGDNLGETIYLPQAYEYDSVGSFCEYILKEHKYVAGRFTTYALKRPCEHILVNGKTISQRQFASIGEKIFSSEYFTQNTLTQIEVVCLIALFYFVEKKCDYVFMPNAESSFSKGTIEEFSFLKRSLSKQIFSYKCYQNLEVNVVSKTEAKNSAIAIAVLEEKGILLKEKNIRKALLENKCQGKFEILKVKPYFIVDGANEAEATKLLMANLQYYFPDNPYIFIIGTMQDNYEGVVKESVCFAQQIITITPPEMRDALPSYELANEVKKLNHNITNASSIEEAVELANLLSDKNTVVVGFGDISWLDRYKKTVVT